VERAGEYAPDEIEYRRVRLRGDWVLDDVMFLANRARYSVRGEEVIVPVMPDAGGPAVLVNIGWIPDGARDDVMRDLAAAGPGGITSGLGVDASSRSGNQIPSGSWSNLDPGAMSEALDYDLVEWIILAGEERSSPP